MVARPLTAATHFPGRFSCKANGHGRAMLAPTSVFRQFRGGVKTPPYRAKGKIRIKGNVPGRDKSRPCAQEAKLNNGKAAGRALGGAQRAPPVCKQTRSCGCLLHAHNPAMPGLYASVRFSLLTLFRCSPCPKLQSCLHNKRSRLWKKSKQARSAAGPRRKASASATPPCANGCASMNPRVQTALHPGKSPATLPPRKSRPPWRSTSRAGSHCLTSAKSTASAARKTCKSSWKRRRRAASCAATTVRPATGAARTPPPRTGKRSCGNAWPTAAITAQLR